jgi:alkaline phosphatase
MIKHILFCIGTLILLFTITLSGQKQRYTTANGHAHNDYLNVRPFNTAFENGFGSIEVDVFPVNGKLLVAHDRNKIDSSRTIENMYLLPLATKIKEDTFRIIKLLVDFKGDYKESLAILIDNLRPLVKYLSTPEAANRVTILISGRRPSPSEYNIYPSYIFFDDDWRLPHSMQDWNRVGQVSIQFSRYSRWSGSGKMVAEERKRLQQVIDSVHQAGKTIRFWGAPDNIESWECQVELGADLIGTDRVGQLAAYLGKTAKGSLKERP